MNTRLLSITLVMFLSSSCGSINRVWAPQPEPKSATQQYQDDQEHSKETIATLQNLLKQCHHAMGNNQFTLTEAILEKSDSVLQNISARTKQYPDFDELLNGLKACRIYHDHMVRYTRWQEACNALLQQLSAALAQVDQAQHAQERLQAHLQAIDALNQCANDPSLQPMYDGANTSTLFKSPWGELSAPALLERCSKEMRKRVAQSVEFKRQALAEVLQARLVPIGLHLHTVGTMQQPNEQIKTWQLVLGGLQECVDRCHELLALDGHINIQSTFGVLSVEALQKRCVAEQTTAQNGLKKAQEALQIELFITSCHHDEIDVVKRMGMPTHIETHHDGRAFIYPKQRFDFDTTGMRVLKHAHSQK